MKVIVIFLVMFLAASMLMSIEDTEKAEDKVKLKKATGESGEGPITSGLDLGLEFLNSKLYFRFKFSEDRGYGLFTYNVLPFLSTGVSAGFFKGLPNFGPYVDFKPVKFVSVLYWHTWGFGEVGDVQFKIQNVYDFVGVFLDFGIIKPSFSVSWFQGERYLVPDIELNIPFLDEFEILIGIGYELREEKSMFRLGLAYYFEKNQK